MFQQLLKDIFFNFILLYFENFILSSLIFHLKFDHPERAETKFFLDGFWVPCPRNPGRYARFYGVENLKHVTWHRVTDAVYENFNGFKNCSKNHYPIHSCLSSYAPDGNIQFRDDYLRRNFI